MIGFKKATRDNGTEEAHRGSTKLRLKNLRKEFVGLAAVKDISLELNAGEMLALLGPSGCGKTTTLRMIAGLETPTNGSIEIDGRKLADDNFALPPEDRRLGMVFQSYALWPHMSVAQNVGFSLQRAGFSKKEIETTVNETLRLVEMSDYRDRPSSALSGGQQQRIAIARALASKPTVMLFDEPLSNLDAVLRESMRMEIRDIQRQTGMTGIYVTHSQEEALALADKVAVMNDGVIQQLDTPLELYERPRNRFVAGFVGLSNVVKCELVEPGTSPQVRVFEQTLRIAETARNIRGSAGDEVSLAARPENIRIVATDHDTDVPASGLLVRGVITKTVFSGNLIDYFVAIPGVDEDVRVQSLPPAEAAPGDAVQLQVSPNDLVILED